MQRQLLQRQQLLKVDTNVLYAQEITNGYQLVDSTPKVVYVALKTSMKDVYMIKGSNGTISKKNGVWVAEYYEGDTLIQKELNIKLDKIKKMDLH